MALGNVLPSLYKPTSAGKFILDLAFRDCALILKQSTLLVNPKTTSNIPLPLIGFSFNTPESISFLDYTYCEYPYLNKTMITNAMGKNNSSLTISAARPIIRANPIILNMITNQVLIKTIETYTMRGGTFMLLTMWGTINDLVLERLEGMPTENGNGGVMFKFTLKKINFANIEETKSAAQRLTNIALGAL